MFEDILRKLDAAKRTVNAQVPTVKDAIRDQLPFMEIALVEALIDRFESAMDQIPEYSNEHAEPLRDHLIDNLQTMEGEHPAHVRLADNGEPVILFDEDFAGTASDFERGKHHSFNDKNATLKFVLWKYGIYKPDVEGEYEETRTPWVKRAMEKLPSYDEIIQERLQAWGRAAPYWYFIDRGTAGGNRAYPSFPGTNVVRKFRKEARDAIREFIRGLIDELEAAVVDEISKSFETGSPRPPLAAEVLRRKILTRTNREIWINAKGQFAKRPRRR